MSFVSTLIKITFLAALFFGVSQIEIKNKKIYFHTEEIVHKLIDKYGPVAEKKFSRSIKEDLSKYLKTKISSALDEPVKTPQAPTSKLNNSELNMDEQGLQKVIGK